MERLLEASKLIRKAERMEEAANKAKDPEKVADLRFNAWVLKKQAEELMKKN